MERTLKLDDEIRLVEERIAGGRTRLGRTADQLGDTARDAVASPGGCWLRSQWGSFSEA